MFHSVYSDLFCCFVYCVCVNVYCTTATGVNPIAGNYHVMSYHIISYHIISYHTISYHIISYIISYHIIYHIISYRIISYHIISYIISYLIPHTICPTVALQHHISELAWCFWCTLRSVQVSTQDTDIAVYCFLHWTCVQFVRDNNLFLVEHYFLHDNPGFKLTCTFFIIRWHTAKIV
jgi:hypothetical protein